MVSRQEESKIKISVRLLPSTLQSLRDGAVSAGFANQISLYAESVLKDLLPIIAKWQNVHGVPSDAVRHERKTVTLKVSLSLLDQFSLETVRLHMRRRTDLIEAALIIGLGQRTEVARRRRLLSVEPSTDGRSMTLGK